MLLHTQSLHLDRVYIVHRDYSGLLLSTKVPESAAFGLTAVALRDHT